MPLIFRGWIPPGHGSIPAKSALSFATSPLGYRPIGSTAGIRPYMPHFLAASWLRGMDGPIAFEFFFRENFFGPSSLDPGRSGTATIVHSPETSLSLKDMTV
jgi:hypothetical protein